MQEFITFVRHLFHMLIFVRGVLLSLILILFGFALITAKVDGVPLPDALYFTFITALTVGYGDIVPTTGVTRAISVLTGFIGVIYVGLVVAVSTRALELAVREERQLQRDEPSCDKEH
jgi:predicted permease